MSIYQSVYTAISKSFKYERVKKLKRKLRPVKWAVFGKEGIYKAIDRVNDLEKAAHARDTATVFDIGAADGEYAVTFAQSFPNAQIYCFEPQSASFSKLEDKVTAYPDRVRCFKFGFYNKNTKSTLNLDIQNPDGSSLLSPPETEKSNPIKNFNEETITVRTLDDFCTENKINHIDFLKIDVEGVEKEVLEGGVETLKNKVDNIFIEISVSRKGKYSANYIEVLKLLNDAGFALIEISETENFFLSKLV